METTINALSSVLVIVGILVALLILLPTIIFQCVKMAVLAYKIAKYKFERDFNPLGLREDEESDHEHDEEESGQNAKDFR